MLWWAYIRTMQFVTFCIMHYGIPTLYCRMH